MFKPLSIALDRIIHHGDLSLVTSDGVRHRFGDGTGTPVRVELSDRRLEWQLALNPQLAAGEAYMDGRLVVREGDIHAFLDLVISNMALNQLPSWSMWLEHARYLTRRIAQYNPAGRARRNVAHHYDIDGRLYDLFLDSRRQYSCAYFTTPDTDLEEAQVAKLDHIAAKLDVRDGQTILDIGSGWGGLAVHLAQHSNVHVDGVTLSIEQLKGARARAASEGSSDAVRFHLQDYRALKGTYDRIVSVGMFEHVGINHFDQFFGKVRDLLAPDGVALIHTIGRSGPPCASNPFVTKYIFPGGYIPALSEITAATEREGLLVTDIEVLRLHYAETLRHWRERFRAGWNEARRLRDERFCRMWEFYLAGSECSFRHQGIVVFQIQLAKRPDAVPIVRDYMVDAERTLHRQAPWGGEFDQPRMAGE
ncbi:MAG: cyclopropane-fatty-acyl-phospholipid synthase family protein [Hyphomicrobiaceae bacterium]